MAVEFLSDFPDSNPEENGESGLDALTQNAHQWNELAGSIDSTFPLERLRLASWLNPSDRVLDFGCGDGRGLRLLAQLGFKRAYGFDIAPRMISLAANVISRKHLAVGRDPRAPAVPWSSFDAVLVVGVLSSVVPLAEREHLLRYIVSLLRSGGAICLADFGRGQREPYLRRYRQATVEPFTFQTPAKLWIHHFTVRELHRLLKNCGMKVTSTTSSQVRTLNGRSLPGHVVTARLT